MPFRSSPSAATDAALLSSEEVIARLEQGFRENAMLAFDADGTLWSGDIGVETFETVLERRALRQHALEALQAEAQLYDVPLYADVNDQARQLHEAYQGGRYPEERAFPMMAWVFAGFRTDEMRAFGRDVIEKRALSTRIHREILPIVHWAARRGLPVYVVSVSQVHVVRVAVERLLPVVNDVIAND